MAITSLSDFFVAMKSGFRQPFAKVSMGSMVAGQWASCWYFGTYPAAGALPTTAAVCSDSTTGALPIPSRSAGQDRVIGLVEISAAYYHGLTFEDRLIHMAGLSGTVTTAQTVNVDASVTTSNMVARIGNADYSELLWYLDWYVATGGTAVTATVAVTYADDTTGTETVSLPASVAAHRRYQVVTSNGKFIKSIQTVTLSATTGTAGNFGVTVVRRLLTATAVVANRIEQVDWTLTGCPSVPDNACVAMSVLTYTTITGQFVGSVTYAVG